MDEPSLKWVATVPLPVDELCGSRMTPICIYIYFAYDWNLSYINPSFSLLLFLTHYQTPKHW